MRIALFLMLLLPLSMACNGSISQQVPAVIGDGGGIVNITASLIPGDGSVYVDVFPHTGVMTQESIERAVSYAHFLRGEESSCDILVSFKETANYIEGPSAGTALAVMSYALLENKTLRNDTVITGAVDYAGNVGPVGGLYEKAKSAAAVGARYFITPVANFYEVLLLKNIESQYGISIIEAQNVLEVIEFMTENKSIEQKGISARKREIPALEDYRDTSMEGFDAVAEAMVDLENGVLNSVIDVDDETEDVKEFFDNELERQSTLIRQGYLFSAANEAFLNYIDLATIKAILEDDVDLPRKKGDISICLSRVSSPAKTDRNFEWIVGADLRQQWASGRLDMEIDSGLLQDEKFFIYNELMYGEAWCHVADELISAAPEGGEAIDEEKWAELAQEMLSEARSMKPAGDLADRLSIAEDSYRKGLYGAAVFDSVFVIENMKAEVELAGGADIEGEVVELLAKEYRGLWSRIYQSHGAFLYQLNETGTAYRTLMLADGLEQAVNEMSEAEEEMSAEDGIYIVIVAATISMFLLFVLLIFIVRRVHASKRNRKTYRTRQKKGWP